MFVTRNKCFSLFTHFCFKIDVMMMQGSLQFYLLGVCLSRATLNPSADMAGKDQNNNHHKQTFDHISFKIRLK